jgi:hypothetical protein
MYWEIVNFGLLFEKNNQLIKKRLGYILGVFSQTHLVTLDATWPQERSLAASIPLLLLLHLGACERPQASMAFILIKGVFRVVFMVARWFIFKPKITIWVNFGGPWNGKICYTL